MTRVELTCPYCKVELSYPIEDVYGPQVILCCIEEGGCDEYFGVAVIMKPMVKYYEVREKV